MQNQAMDDYIRNRFSVGLAPYEESLRKNGLDPSARKILDIGCGPGQWSFAAANVARNAEVWGIDPNQQELDFAREYAKTHGQQRTHFDIGRLSDVEYRFDKSAFDVIMCNGVLMYLDRHEAFRIFRHFLRPGGRLFLFHNHHIGYYMYKALRALREGSIRQLYGYGFKALLLNPLRQAVLGANDGDAVLTQGYLKRIAARHGIRLEQIPNEPQLSYKPSFLCLPYVYSLRGEVT